MTKESTQFEKGDIVLYKDRADGHFIPDIFMAVVVSEEEHLVAVDVGNDVHTSLIKENCRKISKEEHFKLILEGVFNVKPSEH